MKFFILSILITILPMTVNAVSFKCWTNTDGIKECGNSLPPQYANQRIQYHNSKSGNINEVKEAAKTKEQILKEKEQERQNLLKERQIAKQNAYDNVLLKTYLTIDDILLSLDWKVTTLNSQIKIAQGSIKGLEQKFIDTSAKAAQNERSGGKIPKQVKSELDSIRHKTSLQKQHIKKLMNDKKNIHEKFKHDSERFIVSTINGISPTLDEYGNPKAKFISQIKCQNEKQCEQIWQRAKQYVRNNSKLPVIFDTDMIYVNQSPENPAEFALTISKVEPSYKTKAHQLITLQLRCHPSPEGEENCEKNNVKQILVAFKSL
ncbi:MAG: hypothetical protein HQL46_08340 [Gammaproteobacteria bacterium]|nr:hypothetical protein [Gammaproteobacteria bacterium]